MLSPNPLLYFPKNSCRAQNCHQVGNNPCLANQTTRAGVEVGEASRVLAEVELLLVLASAQKPQAPSLPHALSQCLQSLQIDILSQVTDLSDLCLKGCLNFYGCPLGSFGGDGSLHLGLVAREVRSCHPTAGMGFS